MAFGAREAQVARAPRAGTIEIRGARQNNLAGVDVSVPRGALSVITGVSGSGKSSLAFQTLYAEGQRRYVESFSTYARQFLERMDRPDVDTIEGLIPAVAIEQRNTIRSARSTLGTLTELTDYLKVLFARRSVVVCHVCGSEVRPDHPQTVVDGLVKDHEGCRVVVGFPFLSSCVPPLRRVVVPPLRRAVVWATSWHPLLV